MARLSLKAVEERVAPLAARESYDREFIFDLLIAFGKPQGNVTRLRNGSLNVAVDTTTEVAQKNVVYFKETANDPLEVIEELKTTPAVVRFSTRFVIVTDYVDLIAHDTKTNETIGFPIQEIDQHFTFFLPWAGMEKAQYVAESHADVKAAERMGKLFDELLHANPGIFEDERGRHSLNIFFTRLLFCFFAEDTGIFGDNQFTNAIGSQTQPDGSDLAEFLTDLFKALDTEYPADKPKHLAEFPYVNGRLFTVTDEQTVPRFTKQAREELISSGKLIWRDINPDIFGSMFQAIVTPGKRSDLGQHYTSVPNILKTIEPLFLDDLKEEINESQDSERRMVRLLDRIAAIKVFDPACGSGNFLVIAYKELRKLEHAILERLAELSPSHQMLWADSRINIENFYGIEIDDFAVEVAILSLWIAKHQMNREFREKFRVEIPLIPLKETGQIKAGNATRVDWNTVCPNDNHAEIYLIGNPPYKGANDQTDDMKRDFPFVFENQGFPKSLDYIALWFKKGADYIRDSSAKLAFVSTNSITQGQQVELLSPYILNEPLEIGYAYTSFKWQNNAKHNAGVTVVVVSLRNRSADPKYLFTGGLRLNADNINGYLADGSVNYVSARRSALAIGLAPMAKGSQPTDGGNLVLDSAARAELLATDPRATPLIKEFLGADEFIDGKERYCLWIADEQLELANSIPQVRSRLAQTAIMRRASKKEATRKFAETPHRFTEIRYKPTNSIIVPSHSSSRRSHIPIGYLGPDAVISNAAFAVYDADPWLFALISSRSHTIWAAAVGGQIKTDYRYSNTIVYNNFPVPLLSDAVKEKLTVAALRVLDVREYHCEQTLAELYDPDKMPQDLRDAHAEIDALVDSIYSKKPYETDEQRLSDLFAMYERMTAEEAAKAPAKKTRRTAK
ncbi:Type II restriction enzyme, methylase subunit YeeA [Microbacterium esteraromaticum]|uniref:site-specific DNA-methyltransferase (adenine-specific) n=1 Tax=Microbacterium esteraromaticum TaxID=57043 RepID=A0A1R4KGQ4_9MICO|nr:DNA methyltransferase [Microbacterium esteraromaticum]SJN43223.1 Type II restriction enzyme, methylase subunit YeeA [Microbacterium esteraromaticum]